jgi:hypothetical protein
MTPKARSSRLQGSRRRDRRLGALPGRQPGLLRLRAAREGFRAPRRSTSGFPAARSRPPIAKALFERGIDPKKTKILGQDVVADDSVLKGLGAQSVGIITVTNYDYNSPSALGKSFLKGFNEISGGRNPDIFAIGGYDGMHLIYESLKKTSGNADGEALIEAAKA